MTAPLVKLMRLASMVICVIVVVSFAIFVVDQSKSASAQQTRAIAQGVSTSNSGQGKSKEHEGTVHKTIDEASERLTSPFAGVVSGSSSEWVIRGVKLLLALVVYGFGLSFLARFLQVKF